jgi:integrase
MSRPNVHGLPQHLRKDVGGYFLDYFVQDGGNRKRVRVRLGQIPMVQAKKVLAQHMKTIVEEKYLGPDKAKVTFFEAADSFLAYSKARKKGYRNDASAIAGLKAFLGDRPLDSLTLDLVEAYLVQRQQEGQKVFKWKKLSGATLNRDLACLKTIIHRAILNRMIDRNPIMGVKKFKEYSRNRTISPEEFKCFLRYCPPHLNSIVQLAFTTGMRCGEILGLRWEQVNLKDKVIVLEATDTKTQEKREVPLTDELIGIFQRTPKTLGSPNVFTFRGKAIGTVKTAFSNACRMAGIKDFKFHDLRHCAVTNFRKAGIPDSVIMSISGHKTYAVFRKYDWVDRTDRLLAVRKVQSFNDTDMTAVEQQASN